MTLEKALDRSYEGLGDDLKILAEEIKRIRAENKNATERAEKAAEAARKDQ